MPKINLSGMTVEGLMDLRERVEETLHKRRAELQQQLAALGVTRVGRGDRSVLKGKKCHPSIAVRQARLGQVVAQNLVGLLLPSKVERSLRIC